jgi:hypothetical protein
MTSEELRSRANELLDDLNNASHNQIKNENLPVFEDLKNRYDGLCGMRDIEFEKKLVSEIEDFYKLNDIVIPYNGGDRRRSSTPRKSSSSRRRRSTKRRATSRKQQKRRRATRRRAH